MQKKMHTDVPIALVATSLVSLGIRSLKASLKEIGINSELYFVNTESVRYTNSEIKQIIKALWRQDPKIIGISTIELSSIRTEQLIKAIKLTKYLKDKILVVGGIHATLCPDEYIDLGDIVVIGEGEKAFLELAENILNGREYCNLKNLWVRRNGRVIKNEIRPLVEDINRLPLEDYSPGENLLKNGKLIKLNDGVFIVDYPPPPRRTFSLFTARGCTRRCSFCINGTPNKIYQGKVRRRHLDEVVRYLERIKSNNPELEFVYLMEDDFFLRTNREIDKFAEEYKNKIGLPFFLNCTPETVTEEKLKLLVEAGLRILNMGIQTGSERINRLIYNRKVSNNRILEATKIIAKYGYKIEPVYDFITNNPYETKEDLLATIDLIKKIPKPFRLSIHFLVFYKGTVLYKKALEDRVIDKNYCKAQFNLHNASNQLEKDEVIYLKSVIFWMDGTHTLGRYGLIPSKLLDILILERFNKFFQKLPQLISLFNKFSEIVLYR